MRTLSYDPVTGIRQVFRFDHQTNKSIVEHIQDVEPILDHNHRMAQGLDRRQDWWFVGTIPDSVVIKWAVECNAKPYSKKWRKYAAKQLNSAEYAKLNPNRIRVAEKD